MAATVQRRRLSLGVLVMMTALGVALCVLMLGPFVPGLAWALALAVTALPLHRRVLRVVKVPNLAAGISVCLVDVDPVDAHSVPGLADRHTGIRRLE